jgi:hypothetical protein
MFIFFIVFIIFKTSISQKYVICIKTTTSPKTVLPNKHINRLARRLAAPILSTSTTIPCTSMHRTAMQSLSIHCTPMHRTPMHHSAIHHSSMHSTPRHPAAARKRPELFCECPNTSADRFYRFFRVYLCILSWSFLCFVWIIWVIWWCVIKY